MGGTAEIAHRVETQDHRHQEGDAMMTTRTDAVRIPMYLAVTARDAVRPPRAVRHPATEARRDVDAGARQDARAPHSAEAVTAARHPASAEVTDGVDATAKDTGPAPL